MAEAYFKEGEDLSEEYSNILEIEVKDLDRKTREAFTRVKRDVLVLQEKVKFFKDIERVTKDITELKKQSKTFADNEKTNKLLNELRKRMEDEINKLNKYGIVAEKSLKFNEKISKLEKSNNEFKEEINKSQEDIQKQISSIDVKRIDLNKIEAKINAYKNILSNTSVTKKDFEDFHNDFIKLKREALTTYKFEKLENWIKSIEKDVSKIVGDVEAKKHLAKKSELNETDDKIKLIQKRLETLNSTEDEIRIMKSEVNETKKHQKMIIEMIKALSKKMEKSDKKKSFNIKETSHKEKKEGLSKADNFYKWLNE